MLSEYDLREARFPVDNAHISALVNKAFVAMYGRSFLENVDSLFEFSASMYEPIGTASHKPILVFVHGYLDNAASFAKLLPYFDDYPCVAIDLPGHGFSAHRGINSHYHLVDYAYDLHSFISALEHPNIILIGHSLGGIVGSIYAATRPEYLACFIAIESCGPLSQETNTTSEQLKQSFKSRERANKPIKHPASFTAVVNARCAVSDLSSENAALILQRNIQQIASNKFVWRTDKRLRTQSCMRMTEEQAQNILDNIECQRTIIIGEQGFDKVKRLLAHRSACFTNSHIEQCAGGHHVHMESPAAVAKVIQRQIKLSQQQ